MMIIIIYLFVEYISIKRFILILPRRAHHNRPDDGHWHWAEEAMKAAVLLDEISVRITLASNNYCY